MQRRSFLKASLAAIVTRVQAQAAPVWGGPVLDTHLHLRADPAACFTHMQGCGVTHAVLLTRVADEEKAQAEMAKRPGHFACSVSADPAAPDASETFRKAIAGGAVSIGELKYHLALHSAEMRRVYDIAADMQVPVMMHIQTFPHFQGELPYNTGYERFDRFCKPIPKQISLGTEIFSGPTSAQRFRLIAVTPPVRLNRAA